MPENWVRMRDISESVFAISFSISEIADLTEGAAVPIIDPLELTALRTFKDAKRSSFKFG